MTGPDKLRAYRGVTITRVSPSGYYSARAGTGRALLADTLDGMRALIRAELDGRSGR